MIEELFKYETRVKVQYTLSRRVYGILAFMRHSTFCTWKRNLDSHYL